MGSPVINSKNVWDIYCKLHYGFEHLDDAVNFIENDKFTLTSSMHKTTWMMQQNHHLEESFTEGWKIVMQMVFFIWVESIMIMDSVWEFQMCGTHE